jgi:hypothetical protein
MAKIRLRMPFTMANGVSFDAVAAQDNVLADTLGYLPHYTCRPYNALGADAFATFEYLITSPS